MPWILSFRNWWWICPYYPDTPAKRLYHKSLWEFWYECFSSFLSHHKIAGISNYYILMIEILSYPMFFFFCWSGSTGCMVSLDTCAFVCGWGIPVDLNGVLLPVMSGVYLWGHDARLPQVWLSFCLCCVMVEPPFLPASRWAKAS